MDAKVVEAFSVLGLQRVRVLSLACLSCLTFTQFAAGFVFGSCENNIQTGQHLVWLFGRY